jgi:hypothetical protein
MDSSIRKAWHYTLLSAILLQLFACGGAHDDSQEEQTYRIGGFVTGLTGSGLVLQNNGGDDLPIEASGTFSFPTRLVSGSDYLVTIATQPSEQSCTVVNGTGTLAQSDSTQVIVSCPLEAVTPEISAAGAKLLHFAWNDVGADYYRLLENRDGQSGYTQVGDDVTGTQVDKTISLHLTDWVNASYLVQACNSADLCSDSAPLSITSVMLDTIGYLKASDDIPITYEFGSSVALSNSATTLAVAAKSSYAVHIFLHNGTAWSQSCLIDTSVNGKLSLSGDGNTLAVADAYDDSPAVGINGDESDNGAWQSGAVRVFIRDGDSWSQQAYIKASNTEEADLFGKGMALSSDGNTLAVGALGEDSSATGIDGDQIDNSLSASGAVYLFENQAGTWTQTAYLKASNPDQGDHFGSNLALSDNGNILAVGAKGESSVAAGINGDQIDNSLSASGAVYLFENQADTWTQTAYFKASNPDQNDYFGANLALSGNGNILAVGASGEDSVAAGINGDQSDKSDREAGAAYVFSREDGLWSQKSYVKALITGISRTECEDHGFPPRCWTYGSYFGGSLALSNNGDTLVVGAPGVFENDGPLGAVYLY